MTRLLYLLIAVCFINSGCNIVGCPDPNSESYEPSAIYSSDCYYRCGINFWWDEDTANSIAALSNGVELCIDVDGSCYGCIDISNHFPESPGCCIDVDGSCNYYELSSLEWRYSMGDEPFLQVPVTCKIGCSDPGITLWSEVVSLNGGGCISIEITL